jgi:hypothetical protein
MIQIPPPIAENPPPVDRDGDPLPIEPPEIVERIQARRAAEGLFPLPIVELKGDDDLHRFPTGAVRSKDVDHFRYDLITPIGMREMARFFGIAGLADFSYDSVNLNLNGAMAAIQEFKGGVGACSDVPAPLLAATAYTMAAIQAEDDAYWAFPGDFLYGGDGPAPDPIGALFRYDRIPPRAWDALAAAYCEGAIKFGAFNCERGMDVPTLLNHSEAHVRKHFAGDRSEPHLGHALWNLMMSIHSLVLWPRLNEGRLRREGCIPPNVTDEQAADWGSYSFTL